MATILMTGSGTIWQAPYGTPPPASVSEPLDPAFTNVGAISEDGMHQVDTPVYRARRRWNSFRTDQQLPAGLDTTVDFTPLEYTETVLQLAYGGGTWLELGDGTRRYDPPPAGEASPHTYVCDAHDGPVTVRTVFPAAIVVSTVDRTFAQEATRSQITLALLEAWWQYDNL